LACDYDRCRHALDQAAALSDTGEAGTPGHPVIGSASVPGDSLHELVAGWCLHDLGRYAEAAEVLDRQLLAFPGSARRAYARFGARRALAYLAAGEVEHASALTAETLDATALVDSATVRHDLRLLTHSFVRWRRHGPVRELYPRLTAALRRPLL
jgi:tetratricopeptide (TPR) repeat protein